MGQNKNVFQREAYTILGLLGDFGGFADALVLIVGLVGSFYSGRMFTAAISEELPYSHKGVRNFTASLDRIHYVRNPRAKIEGTNGKL